MVKSKGFRFKNILVFLFVGFFSFVLMACGDNEDKLPNGDNTPKVEEVTLSKTEIDLTVGDEENVVATIKPSDLEVEVDWSSSDNEIATVDSEGLIKAVGAGEATITAKALDKSATVKVTVTIVTYNVIFESDEGTVIPIQTVVKGNKVTKPEDPTKRGFEFTGWYTAANLLLEYDFDSPITGNTIIYAGWERIQILIHFDTNDGEELEAIKKNLYSEISDLDLAITPIKTGHTFLGWYFDKSLTDKAEQGITLYEDTTLYAAWKVNEYTVSFVLDNGEERTAIKALYGALIEVNEPSRIGHDFAGWYIDEERLEEFDIEVDTIFGDMTLYVKWDVGSLTVVFNSNGGSVVPDIIVETFKTITEPITPTKPDMIFKGWYADEDLNNLFDFDTQIEDNITLYAKWELDSAAGNTVEFELNGGSFPITSKDFFIKYGYEPVATFNSFIYEGNPWAGAPSHNNLHVQQNVTTGSYWAKACLKLNEFGQYEIVDFVASGAVQMGNYDYVLSSYDQSGAAHAFVMSLQIGQIITITGAVLDGSVPRQTVFENAVVKVYNSAAGSETANTNLVVGAVDLPVPIKADATFAGWYDNEELTGSPVTEITGNIKLYAKWE